MHVGRTGALGMVAGDCLVYAPDGRQCVVDEFYPDGEATVTFSDGNSITVKWWQLKKEE